MAVASASGLFRAMGKKGRPVAMRDLLTGELVKAEGLVREENEFYPTPPAPTRALLAVEGARLAEFPRVWEPAVGDGAMAALLRGAGFDVHGSDLIDRGCDAELRSFYDFSTAPAPAIVTNPPFAEVGWKHGRARWLYHALDTLAVDYMALLLNWTFPGAGGLAAFWEKHPPARVYLMRWKIDFTGQGAPPMLNAWFVWDRAWRGETVLRMLDRIDDAQGLLFKPGARA